MAVSQQDQKPTLPPLPKQSHKFFFDDSTDSTLPSPPTDSQTLDFDESMYSNHPPPPTGQTIAREDFADLASPPPPPPPPPTESQNMDSGNFQDSEVRAPQTADSGDSFDSEAPRPPPPTFTILPSDSLAIQATVAEVEEHVKQAVASIVEESCDERGHLKQPLVQDEAVACRGVRWLEDDKVASMHEINQSLPPEIHLSKTPLVDSLSEGLGPCAALLLIPLFLAALAPVGVASYCVFGL
mmetsp:Transcript_40672/g.87715  ORF Transcript_40672/g.87715 Transcript_40672/m.87715 type:complete len:241 (-) Transcript_40672:137-859(-)